MKTALLGTIAALARGAARRRRGGADPLSAGAGGGVDAPASAAPHAGWVVAVEGDRIVGVGPKAAVKAPRRRAGHRPARPDPDPRADRAALAPAAARLQRGGLGRSGAEGAAGLPRAAGRARRHADPDERLHHRARPGHRGRGRRRRAAQARHRRGDHRRARACSSPPAPSSPPAAYGPKKGFRADIDLPQGAQEVSGEAEMIKAVREQAAHGRRLDQALRRLPHRPGRRDRADPDPDARWRRRWRWPTPPAAPSPSTPPATRASATPVLAGVDTIEHGYGASEATFKLMKAKGVAYMPDPDRAGGDLDLLPALCPRPVAADPGHGRRRAAPSAWR